MDILDKEKRERIVKGMKRSKSDLQRRYGERWKDVMYATATKQASESTQSEAYQHKQTYLKTAKNNKGEMEYHRVHATMNFERQPKTAASASYQLKNHPLHKKLTSQGYEASHSGHDTKDSYYTHKVAKTQTMNENDELDVNDDVEEALNIQARLKKSRLMKRIAPKLARMRKIKSKRRAPMDVLKKRAHKVARNLLRKKLAGERGANYKDLSPSAKQTVDRLLDGKDKVVSSIVRRVMPSVRRKEQERVRGANTTKNEEFLWESQVIIMKHPKEDRHVIARKVGNNVVMRFKENGSVSEVLKKKAKEAQDHLQSLGRVGWKLVEASEIDEKMTQDKDIKNLYVPNKTTKYELQNYIDKKRGKKSREKDYYKKNADVIEEPIDEVVRKTGSTWTIFSKDGSKKLGEYDTKEAAQKRLGQIEYFKNVKEVKSPQQKIQDFEKSRVAAGKSSMINNKPQTFHKMKKPGTMTTMNVRPHEVEKYQKMGFKKIEESEDKDIGNLPGSQPKKYHTGLKKSTKVARNAHFKKGAEMDDNNPAAYEPAPGDANAKTKLSKYTKKYKKMFGEEIEGLKKKAEKSGVSYGILKKVYDRGIAAWRTGHRPGTTPQQWAYARVNSFLTGGKTRTTADSDLWSKVRKESIDESGGAGEMGTDKLTKTYIKDTPGQEIQENDGPTVPHIELPLARENYVIKMLNAGKSIDEVAKTCRVSKEDVEHIQNKVKE